MRKFFATSWLSPGLKRHFSEFSHTTAGRATVFTFVLMATTLVVTTVAFFEVNVPVVHADDVTTSVTVLNTPPQWSVDAEESTESSTSTPTNVGSVLSFTATATDSNNDPYFLLICKASSTPSAVSNAPPSCGGGASNLWVRSATTSSGAQATAATTTYEYSVWANESNAWYAYICDANSSLARCNGIVKTGSGLTASPFVINHPPVFNSVSNDAPKFPGQLLTWTTSATDTDVIRGGDTMFLYICKATDFTGSACGAGGTWATSTFYKTPNPTATTTLPIPTQDKTYNAYAYIVDQSGRQATSTRQGSNSSFAVSNATPSISAATVSLVDTDGSGNLTLLNSFASTSGFRVQFQVDDDNSCQNATAGNEISSSIINVYRSGVTQASCQVAGDYNANNCYPAASGNWRYQCSQDVGTCSGQTDTSVTWTCYFSLWYNADPTDASTQYTAQNWLASAQSSDDNYATSTLTESSSGNELNSFLAFDVTQTAVYFGALEPGQFNDPLSTTTDLKAYGNVGLDSDIYGDTMCTNWTSVNSCDAGGIDPTREIPIANQKVATSSVTYASSYAYALAASSSPTDLQINVPKTTVTSTPETRNTYWGINIPGAITLAGNYSGQDTITAKKSSPSVW